MHPYKIISRQQVFSGDAGKRRAEFYAAFVKLKQDSFRRIEGDIMAQVASHREKVTCRKGCPVCCVLYIEANIQECEAIACYLYDHPPVLDSFLDRYQGWRNKMKQLGGPFAFCERVLHQPGEVCLSNNDQAALLDVLKRYQSQNIRCSFLEDGSCSIYDVRPYVCANHFVTTPADWCRAENWCNPDFPHHPRIYMTGIDEIDDRSFGGQVLDRPVIGFMPAMVFRILTEGPDYMAEVTGLKSL